MAALQAAALPLGYTRKTFWKKVLSKTVVTDQREIVKYLTKTSLNHAQTQ
jgi:hypothetical protein